MENLYKKRRPTRTFHQSVIDVLRMSPDQFAQFQTLAGQHAGGPPLHTSIPRPKNKILPSTWATLRDVDTPSTLAALMHVEKNAHEDHNSEFHEGGGLWDGTKSLFNGLWYSIGLGPEFENWFGSFDYNAAENKPSKLDNQFAQIVMQSYEKPEDRVDELGDWDRVEALDTERYSVWVDESDKQVHVAVRGTVASMSDLLSDIHILYDNTSGNVDDLVEYLEKVKDLYPGYELDASGHSLGGSELLEAGVEHPDLGYNYNLFNPGHNPFWGLGNAKAAVEDEHFHWYLNSGDMISNTFSGLLEDGTDVHWSKPKHSPLKNHGLAQWTGEEY